MYVILLALGSVVLVAVLLLGLSVAMCGLDSFLSKVSTLTNLKFNRIEKRLVFCQANPNKRASHLVVAFAGAALKMGGMPQEEFKRTLSNVPDCDHLFLVDPLQSWYLNDPERTWSGHQWYSDAISQYTKEYPGKVLFVGNCMGATGCLEHANLARACLLFNPLVNIAKDPVLYRRWYVRRFVPKKTVTAFEETIERNMKQCPRIVAHFSSGTQHYWHRQFLPEQVDVRVYHTDQGVVGYLKNKNELVRLIRDELSLMA
eukprot:TRINITY_DN5850_c0_g1_i1.p1 TRINITY_DN5850_c0_g1~~TRINITY_DN5850_c0_g1_i1.p1  ORF type:complete len:259 (-),score=32.69 TRINITY_DN5850_c0_g1_i1:48-824(-)